MQTQSCCSSSVAQLLNLAWMIKKSTAMSYSLAISAAVTSLLATRKLPISSHPRLHPAIPSLRFRVLDFQSVFRRSETRTRCQSGTTEKPLSPSSKDVTGTGETQKVVEEKRWSFFETWDVPWDWKVTLYVMLPYLMSICLTALMGGQEVTGTTQPGLDMDKVAIQLLLDQLLKTVVKLSVLYVFVSPYRPFPDSIYSYRWSEPFNLRHGWIVWSFGGFLAASGIVFLIKFLIPPLFASQMQNEANALMGFLPLLGASGSSTTCLIVVLGILAPFWEETLYRGFLMTSLTKWLPTPLSVVVTSIIFTFAHQSPGKSLEIFAFGTVLGLVYSQTRNLVVPITMHACWNIGVILTLTFLQLQGHNIEMYL